MKKILTVLKWTAIVMVAGFILLVIIRIPHAWDKQKTDEQVAKIHATKLTLDDVMGKNLPPDPGANADKTIEGIDANNNGIRDDVELAIFKEYPNSAKMRMPLLQYALALQMGVTQPIINKETVTEIVREQSRANACVGDTLVPRDSPESERSDAQAQKIDTFVSFIKNRQFNTPERKSARTKFFENIGSYASLPSKCDIEGSVLPN